MSIKVRLKRSLEKLRGLTGLKYKNWRDKRRGRPMAQWEEIAQADQEMKDIRDCYDRLRSAAAATTNSVYEFSESLKEIGDCLLEKMALSSFDDEESGKVLLTLGKVQLEFQRVVDVYKSKEAIPEKRSFNSYHSSPVDKNEKLATNDVVSGPMLLDTKSVLRDSNQHIQSRPSPTPLFNGFSPPQVDRSFPSNTKNVKRYAFSGPLTGKQWQHKPSVTACGPIGSAGHHLLSGSPRGRPLSPSKLPYHTTSTLISPPKISELHELPRPPPHLALKRRSPHFDYSGTLCPKGTELSTANKVVDSFVISILPMPPPLSRSYSIPTRGQVTEPIIREIPSSPLTPLPNQHTYFMKQ